MEPIKLEQADFETGMAFEQRVALAQEAFARAAVSYQAFVEILRQRYNAPASDWTIEDWGVGFVPVKGEDNGRPDNP